MNGDTSITGTAAANTVNVNAGTLSLDGANLDDTAVLTNSSTITLSGDDTVGSLINTGTIAGNATLTAATYALNAGSNITGNLGEGIVNVNGDTSITGTAAANTVNVNAGTLSLDGNNLDDTAAVTNTGNIVLSGGNETIGSLTGSGSINLDGTTLTVAAATGGNVSGVISGSGALTLTSGTQTLSGANTYTGPTNVNGGTLALTGTLTSTTVNVASGALLTSTGGLADATDLTLTGTGSATFTGAEQLANVTAGNGTINATGVDVVVTGSLNSGTSAILVDDLTATTLNGNATITSSGIVTASNGSFGGNIADGSLTKVSAGTLTLTGVNATTDTVNVNAGLLQLNGSVGGNVNVNNTATLRGSNGSIGGNLVVANGATFAPGSSPGVMNVAGNWTQNGVYQSEIAGTGGAGAVNGHDRTNVTGTTTLGGTSTLQLAKLSGFEATLGQSFRTIASTGGIVGQFGTVVSFFDTGIVLDLASGTLYGTGLTGLDGAGLGSQNVDLSQLAGLNGNAQALVTALQTDAFAADPNGVQFRSTTNSGAAILALLTNGAGPAAVADLLSPETYAGDTDYSIRSARNYTQTALGSAPQTHVGSFGLFAAYTSAQGGTESSSNQADYDYTTQGGLAGATVNLGQRASLGVFVAVDSGDITSTFRDGDVDGQVIGLFGEYVLGEKRDLVLTGSFTHGRYEVDSTRTSALGTATATNVDTSVNALSLGLRYDMIVASNYGISPYVAFNYARASTDSFAEAGSADALNVREIDYTSLQGELGARGYIQVSKSFAFTGGLALTQEFGDSETDVDASFGAGAPFKVTSEGAGATEVSANVGARFDVTPRLSFNAGVEVGLVKDGETSSSVFAGGNLKF